MVVLDNIDAIISKNKKRSSYDVINTSHSSDRQDSAEGRSSLGGNSDET